MLRRTRAGKLDRFLSKPNAVRQGFCRFGRKPRRLCRSRKKSAVLLYQVQPGVVLPADKGTPPYRPYDEAPEVYLRYGYLPPDRTRPLQGLRLQPNFKSRHPLDPEPFGVFPDTASQAQQREIRPQGLNRSRGGLPFPAQRMAAERRAVCEAFPALATPKCDSRLPTAEKYPPAILPPFD